MGSIGDSSCKTSSIKYAMEQVPVDAVYFLPKLKQATHPFTSPIPRCDDAVQDINTEANVFIAVYMDSVY